MSQSSCYPPPDLVGFRRVVESLWPDCSLAALDGWGSHHGITQDSRHVVPGMLFIATPGIAGDGRTYIASALTQGAAVVLAEAPYASSDARVIVLPQLMAHLPALIAALYPASQQGRHIAVTGTNGKSSVAHYVAELLTALGESVGVIGTLGMGVPGELKASGLTTPQPLVIAQQVALWYAQGIHYVVLEASSHALDQGRLDGLPLHVGIFTNLTRDHLDYHHSMLGYAAAKARLFRRPELELAIVNQDDQYAALMLAGCQCRQLTVAREAPPSDFMVKTWHPSRVGQEACISTPEGDRTLGLSLLGRFNLDNVVLAVAALYGQGFDLDAVLTAAASLKPVAGRMQVIAESAMPVVVVDYAHTPDALANALAALHQHVPGKLWVIVGCGGNRDSGKRPQMAAIAEQQADHVVITDDNPRHESPAVIRQQMLAGLALPDQAWDIGDRRTAIHTVIKAAQREDVIMIAGKGHEDYQELEGIRYPFDDASVAADAFAARRNEAPS